MTDNNGEVGREGERKCLVKDGGVRGGEREMFVCGWEGWGEEKDIVCLVRGGRGEVMGQWVSFISLSIL